MIVCPNPECEEDLEAFEVHTVYGLTGSRLNVPCPECDRAFEVDVLVQAPRD